MVEYQGNALCQAVKLEGLSSGSERRLEDRIRHLLSHNGVEFIVDTLKQMKQHCIDNLDFPHPYSNEEYGYPYIAWNSKKDRPKGGLGVIYTEFKDIQKRIRVIGAVINTFELDQPSAKQVERFISGVEYNNRTSDDVLASVGDTEVYTLATAIKSRLLYARPFDGTQMTGSVVPEGLEQKMIAHDKKALSAGFDKRDSEARSRAIANLEAATVNQVYLAPKLVHDYVRKYMAPHIAERGEKPVYLKRSTPIKARPYDGGNRFGLHIEDYRPYVGTISMLQQPGAKLRTVVNVNRYINYVMDPFAKAMESTFYRYPQVSVLDQEDGMQWAKEQLRAGRTLASIDLSQATDLLDFRVLTRAITNSKWCNEELEATLELFSYIAESPFYQPDLGVGVTMNTGQPLGLKGSFQVLTAMNFLAGREACNRVGLKDLPFRVVGDDMIIDARAAKEYSDIITSWSGKTNYEKMLTSDRYAEFCSHIITRDKVISMKPKYVAGYSNVYLNAQKTSLHKLTHVFRLTEADKNNLVALAEVSDPGIKNIPYITHSQKLKLSTRNLVSLAKSLYTSLSDVGNSEQVTVSPESVDLALQEHPNVYTKNRRELDRSRYTRTPSGEKVYQAPSSTFDNDRVYNPYVDRYDHKTGRRETRKRELLGKSRKDANVVRKLVDDIQRGKPSDLKLPNHNGTISTTALLVNALEIQEHEQRVTSHDSEMSHAIVSNEIPGIEVPKDSPSLSDAQLKKLLKSKMNEQGLRSHDAKTDVDYSNYLP